MQIPIRTDSPEQAPFPVLDRPNGRHRKKRKEGEDGGLFVRLFSGNPSLSGDGQTFGPHVSRYKHTAGYRR
ncbi:IgG-binding virulence factor TspB family protein [Neisseria gonorrhoeae]|uniref:IgG-binding virulence factor TspB family protein n=1 Tax=Neisseria gonorrhoeae TaxID=485 RepID=UPI0037C576D6